MSIQIFADKCIGCKICVKSCPFGAIQMIDRLAVINSGRCIYSGTPEEMREQARGKVWEAVMEEDFFHELESELDVITHLRTPAGIRVRFLAADAPTEFEAEHVEPTLEDAYIYLLGEHRRAA